MSLYQPMTLKFEFRQALTNQDFLKQDQTMQNMPSLSSFFFLKKSWNCCWYMTWKKCFFAVVLASKCIAPYSGRGFLDTTPCPPQNFLPKLSLFSQKYGPNDAFTRLRESIGEAWGGLFEGLKRTVKTWRHKTQIRRCKSTGIFPRKLTAGTQIWRFGIWCAFPIGWFLGSMLIFQGVYHSWN